MIESLATRANMRSKGGPGVFAFSPNTGEEYSADAADYFLQAEDWTMTDAEGEPMILVRRVTTLEDV